MKIVVLSDTHGDATIIDQVYNQEQDADAFFHCGDSELPYNAKNFHSMHRVRGNCDYDPNFPEDIVVKVGERRVLMTHGHLYNIKMTLTPLDYKAQEAQADIVLFGHSHLLGTEKIGEALFLNPGSLLLPRGGNPKSYATIEWQDHSDELTVIFKEPTKEVISKKFFNILQK